MNAKIFYFLYLRNIIFGLTNSFEQHNLTIHVNKTTDVSSCTVCVLSTNTTINDTVECKRKADDFHDFLTFKRKCLTLFVAANASLKSFIINGYNFSENFNESLFDTKMEHLSHLDLSNNSIYGLNDILLKNLPNLTELVLDKNKLSGSHLLSKNFPKSLKSLSMNSAFSSLDALITEFESLIENHELSLNLSLKNNSINDRILNETLFSSAFGEFKDKNKNFRVDLGQNDFNCDNCQIKSLIRSNALESFINCKNNDDSHHDECLNETYVESTKKTKNTSNLSFSGRNLFIFLFSIIVLASLFVYILNKNRKSLVRAQQRRYTMLHDDMSAKRQNQESSNNNNNMKPLISQEKRTSFFPILFNRKKAYERFSDESVQLPSMRIYELNRRSESTDYGEDADDDVVIMERESLNGSKSNVAHCSDSEELIKTRKQNSNLVILKIPS